MGSCDVPPGRVEAAAYPRGTVPPLPGSPGIRTSLGHRAAERQVRDTSDLPFLCLPDRQPPSSTPAINRSCGGLAIRGGTLVAGLVRSAIGQGAGRRAELLPFLVTTTARHRATLRHRRLDRNGRKSRKVRRTVVGRRCQEQGRGGEYDDDYQEADSVKRRSAQGGFLLLTRLTTSRRTDRALSDAASGTAGPPEMPTTRVA